MENFLTSAQFYLFNDYENNEVEVDDQWKTCPQTKIKYF